jgi:tRNA (guanine37-N1)-methyltransferase
MKNNEEYFIKIRNKDGQKFFKVVSSFFQNNPIINQRIKIEREKEFLYIPLKNDEQLIENLKINIKKTFDFQIIKKNGKPNLKFRHKKLEDILRNEIPPKLIELIPHSFDVIGKIAILEFDRLDKANHPHLISIKKKIAQNLLDFNKNIESVFEKKGIINGKYRLRDLKLLCGKDKTETIHRENKCIFKLDIKKTFFTPRLVYERKRISSCDIKKNECIIDFFAGVGPFSIQIAKNHDVFIHSFDINSEAYQYLMENINLNNLKGKIVPHNLDITQLIEPNNIIGKELQNKADRIIMNLPEQSIRFINVVCYLMKKSGGIVHNYQFCEKPDPTQIALNNFSLTLDQFGWKISRVLNSKIVKSFSPKYELVVLDLKIKENKKKS